MKEINKKHEILTGKTEEKDETTKNEKLRRVLKKGFGGGGNRKRQKSLKLQETVFVYHTQIVRAV